MSASALNQSLQVMLSSTHLLKLALPLVPKLGFTRTALAQSVLSVPALDSSTQPHTEPLSDTAISALFGHGDNARRTLINAWLSEGISCMGREALSERTSASATTEQKPSIQALLHSRLKYNESVLQYLPEAYALLASPSSGIPPLDPMPALKHAFSIADEACYLSGDTATQLLWYARRTALAGVYTAAELHQLTSPKTAPAFLDSLLVSSDKLHRSLDEIGLFSGYVMKSWQGIIRSSGIF